MSKMLSIHWFRWWHKWGLPLLLLASVAFTVGGTTYTSVSSAPQTEWYGGPVRGSVTQAVAYTTSYVALSRVSQLCFSLLYYYHQLALKGSQWAAVQYRVARNRVQKMTRVVLFFYSGLQAACLGSDEFSVYNA